MESITSNMKSNDPYRIAALAARHVLILNFILFVTKAITGWFGGSFALIADAVNNLTDVGLSLGLYFGIKLAGKPPDDNHAYGHGKIETEIGRLIGLVVLATAGGIVGAGIGRLDEVHPPPHLAVLIVAALSIGIKEYMYRYQQRLAIRLSSQALAADALNHRTDVAATSCVLLGSLAVWIGGSKYAFVDGMAAIVVGGIMAFAAGRAVISSSREMLDEMPPNEIIVRIQKTVLEVPGIVTTEKILGRKMGMQYAVDVHIVVNKDMSVYDAHALGHIAKDQIIANVPQVSQVLVHIEPDSMEHKSCTEVELQ